MKRLRKIWGNGVGYDVTNTNDLYFNQFQGEEIRFTFGRYIICETLPIETTFLERLGMIFSFLLLIVTIFTFLPIKLCITGDFRMPENKVCNFLFKNIHI